MIRQYLPNLISLARIILVIPVVSALLTENFIVALILFAIAGFSDALDGFLARHYHWESRLGSILDPIGDKLLLMASFATITWLGLLPLWLFVLVLARDVIIVLGGIAYHYLIGPFNVTPFWSSKFNTAAQVVLVLLVIVQQQWFVELQYIVVIGIWIVTGSVIISGIQYIVVWGLRAWRQMKNQ